MGSVFIGFMGVEDSLCWKKGEQVEILRRVIRLIEMTQFSSCSWCPGFDESVVIRTVRLPVTASVHICMHECLHLKKCEGSLYVWNKMLDSQWAVKGEEGGGGSFKETEQEENWFKKKSLMLKCFLFYRTLNNNNISSIPVSSFNHMPKLRTL